MKPLDKGAARRRRLRPQRLRHNMAERHSAARATDLTICNGGSVPAAAEGGDLRDELATNPVQLRGVRLRRNSLPRLSPQEVSDALRVRSGRVRKPLQNPSGGQRSDSNHLLDALNSRSPERNPYSVPQRPRFRCEIFMKHRPQRMRSGQRWMTGIIRARDENRITQGAGKMNERGVGGPERSARPHADTVCQTDMIEHRHQISLA